MHMKTTTLAAATVVAAAALAPAISSAGVGGGKVILATQMGGKVEVPAGSGDPDGKGFVAVKVNPNKGKLCFSMDWRNIQDPFAAHIHKAPRGSTGRIKLTLFDQVVSSPINRTCGTGIKFGLLAKLAGNPEAYYVNVHNDEYPDGAIRGQLKFAGTDRSERTDVPFDATQARAATLSSTARSGAERADRAAAVSASRSRP